jgi:hypothetical protein
MKRPPLLLVLATAVIVLNAVLFLVRLAQAHFRPPMSIGLILALVFFLVNMAFLISLAKRAKWGWYLVHIFYLMALISFILFPLAELARRLYILACPALGLTPPTDIVRFEWATLPRRLLEIAAAALVFFGLGCRSVTDYLGVTTPEDAKL